MRTVLLLRHAKSDWNGGYSGDHERPLSQRGVAAAELMGRFISQAGLTPDGVLTSTAVRARTTVELAAGSGGWTCPIREKNELYGTTPSRAIEWIRREDDRCRVLLLGGHEPTWSETAGCLIGQATVRMPTAALACVRFEVSSWSEVAPGRGSLLCLITPKLLQQAGF